MRCTDRLQVKLSFMRFVFEICIWWNMEGYSNTSDSVITGRASGKWSHLQCVAFYQFWQFASIIWREMMGVSIKLLTVVWTLCSINTADSLPHTLKQLKAFCTGKINWMLNVNWCMSISNILELLQINIKPSIYWWFVQELVQANKKDDTKALHCWTFVLETHSVFRIHAQRASNTEIISMWWHHHVLGCTVHHSDTIPF